MYALALAVVFMGALQLAAIVVGIRAALRGMREEGAATRASLGNMARRVENAEASASVAAQYVRELKTHAGELVAEQRRSNPGRPRASSQPDQDDLEPWSGPRAHQGSSPGL